MKTNLIILVLLGFTGFSALSGEELYPLANTKLTIKNEAYQGVSGAKITAYCHHFSNDEFFSDNGLSDEKGICLLSLRAFGLVDVVVEKSGYYPSVSRSDRPSHDKSLRFDPFIYRDDIPRSAQQNPPMKKEVKLEASIIMREIKTPIPLYVKRVRMDIPARDVLLGYDFEVGDWVKPHGKGIRSDMRMRSKPKRFDPKSEYGLGFLPGIASLEIDFGDGGGLVRVTKDNGWLSVSEMKMPHLAPAMGYEDLPTLKIEQTNHEDSSEMGKAKGYFFRTRVQRDGDKIISANYGKFWGGINYIPAQRDGAWLGDDKKNLPAFGSVEFIYYFNPTANDRNLEFDMKKNLFKRSDQWIREP